ncbi:MAG TPA: thiamine pyrophosphate-dependent enzyme, partial [Burkholderiaceae bacterium]|nr:thiamine pyrophosphate-dependent enzyme [Burkholderiaceae bacterium]
TLLAAPRPAQKLVHIHAGAEELGRVYAADLLVQASMRCAAPALAGLAPPDARPWAGRTRAARADYEANLQVVPIDAKLSPLDMGVVVQTLQRVLDEAGAGDAILTNGAGNFTGWLQRHYRYPGMRHGGRTQLAPTSGAMGYGLPAAVAAALLQPRRLAVNLAGDGDFLMNGQELATAMAYGARLIAIVVDNGSYGTIRMHQEREYPGRVSGSDLFNPDFAQFARAFGMAADTVVETAQFEPAMRAALARPGPTLLHLKLPAEVSTSRATLSSIRAAARAQGK